VQCTHIRIIESSLYNLQNDADEGDNQEKPDSGPEDDGIGFLAIDALLVFVLEDAMARGSSLGVVAAEGFAVVGDVANGVDSAFSCKDHVDEAGEGGEGEGF
jgi:hypothetical protein